MITTRSVERGASICTMTEFHSRVIHKKSGTTLAAEPASLANAVDSQLYVSLLVEASLKGEPQGGSGSDPDSTFRESW